MKPYNTSLPSVYLKPGEIYIAERPTMVSTVLGSCVSVIMFSRRFRVGAISHGMLPLCRSINACAGQCREGFKYVDCSIRHMMERLNIYGIRSGEIEVKLFGGADIFGVRDVGSSVSVGGLNIKTALEIIRTSGLNMVASDVGGHSGRKIYFYTHTGEVLLSRLKNTVDSEYDGLITEPGNGIIKRGVK